MESVWSSFDLDGCSLEWLQLICFATEICFWLFLRVNKSAREHNRPIETNQTHRRPI